MTFTDLETLTLEAIINSEFQTETGADVVGSSVGTYSVEDALSYDHVSPQAAGGAMASLVSKGAVSISEYDNADSGIAITAEGYAAFTA